MRSTPANGDTDRCLTGVVDVEEGDRREVIRRGAGEIVIEAEHLAGAFPGEDDRAAQDGPDRMELVDERGHDAEVAAAAAQGPEEVRVSRRWLDQFAVCGHDLGRQQVVAGQAVLPIEPADAAAEGQAGDAGHETTPRGVASPCACVARSRSASSSPGSATAIRRSGSTCTFFIDEQSIMSPP